MRCLCLSSEGRIVDEGVRKREVWEDLFCLTSAAKIILIKLDYHQNILVMIYVNRIWHHPVFLFQQFENSIWIYLVGIRMCRRLSQFRKHHWDLNDHICLESCFLTTSFLWHHAGLHTDVHHTLAKLLFLDWATQSCTTKSVLVPFPWHHLVWGEPVPLSAQTTSQLSAGPFHNIVQHLISAVWLFFVYWHIINDEITKPLWVTSSTFSTHHLICRKLTTCSVA